MNPSASLTASSVIFNTGSENFGAITATVTFNDGSANSGAVTGDAVFNGSAINRAVGSVSGNATFAFLATNSGFVTGTVTFLQASNEDLDDAALVANLTGFGNDTVGRNGYVYQNGILYTGYSQDVLNNFLIQPYGWGFGWVLVNGLLFTGQSDGTAGNNGSWYRDGQFASGDYQDTDGKWYQYNGNGGRSFHPSGLIQFTSGPFNGYWSLFDGAGTRTFPDGIYKDSNELWYRFYPHAEGSTPGPIFGAWQASDGQWYIFDGNTAIAGPVATSEELFQ
jgi:hypothetical protein